MSDITMCSNGQFCKLKNTCKRWKSKPDMYQMWNSFYGHSIGKKCEFYIPIIKPKPYKIQSETLTVSD